MNLILDETNLSKLSKPKLLEHIMKQVELIDKLRGYLSNVSKYELINYDTNILIKIALTNNEHIEDLSKCIK